MGPAYCMCTCDNKRKSNAYKKNIISSCGLSTWWPWKKNRSWTSIKLRLQIATRLEHSNYLPNQKLGAASKSDFMVSQFPSGLWKAQNFFRVTALFFQGIHRIWDWLYVPHLRFPVQDRSHTEPRWRCSKVCNKLDNSLRRSAMNLLLPSVADSTPSMDIAKTF
jgi:hypothetical protein